MTKTREVYRCAVCGNVVEVLNPGSEMMCCGRPMTLLKGNNTDMGEDKHVPVVRAIEGGFRVTVGSVKHPMTKEHYIQWIELVTPDCVLRRELKPDDTPVAEFCTDSKEVTVRAYCNLHGLWVR